MDLLIDGKKISVAAGATVLEAARIAGAGVPSMCYREGCGRLTSCMVCLVKDGRTGRLLPSCSAPAADGMEILTGTPDVIAARKAALELLLSEHYGDCEGPCRRGCPAGMDIPQMLRQIGAGQLREAAITVKEHIPLPAVLGRICPAPCEKVCRRAQADEAVSICLLKRYVADTDLAGKPWMPEKKKPTGKRVTIVGAGPCGLSAAYYLLGLGHQCTLMEAEKAAGGALRGLSAGGRLPSAVLESEIEIIRKMGGDFRFGVKAGGNTGELLAGCDVLILAAGAGSKALAAELGLKTGASGIEVDSSTFQTSMARVYAGGNAVKEGKMAVRSVAHGRSIAMSVDGYLSGAQQAGGLEQFDSRMGRLGKEEVAEFMRHAEQASRVKVELSAGFEAAGAVKEAARCLHCDCRKKKACRLRDYSTGYAADQAVYRGPEKKKFELVVRNGLVAYEPGKCIKCGICVKITEKAGAKLGLTFIGRGFDVKVAVPFGESIERGLAETAAECIAACPTGALAGKGG